jgi:hypothetical protein
MVKRMNSYDQVEVIPGMHDWLSNQIPINEPGAIAHAYNPCYSGGRDQEDCGSKPVQANSSRDPILKKKNHYKRDGGVAKDVDSVFNNNKKKDQLI